MHVSFADWLAIAVFAGLALLATRNLHRFWRRGRGLEGSGWWLRGLPVAIAIGWAFLVGALLTILAMSLEGLAASVFGALLALVIVALLGLVALWLSVVLFGRPRRVIPPSLRK
jgi:hypothetical protein